MLFSKKLAQDNQQDQQDPIGVLAQSIEELNGKIKKMEQELSKLKSTNNDYRDLGDYDLNDSVTTASVKKTSFVKIMDELEDLAHFFSGSNPHIAKKLDLISEQLQAYKKGL
jgi:predicted translin family RNA/ssDNA-binding protein